MINFDTEFKSRARKKIAPYLRTDGLIVLVVQDSSEEVELQLSLGVSIERLVLVNKDKQVMRRFVEKTWPLTKGARIVADRIENLSQYLLYGEKIGAIHFDICTRTVDVLSSITYLFASNAKIVVTRARRGRPANDRERAEQIQSLFLQASRLDEFFEYPGANGFSMLVCMIALTNKGEDMSHSLYDQTKARIEQLQRDLDVAEAFLRSLESPEQTAPRIGKERVLSTAVKQTAVKRLSADGPTSLICSFISTPENEVHISDLRKHLQEVYKDRHDRKKFAADRIASVKSGGHIFVSKSLGRSDYYLKLTEKGNRFMLDQAKPQLA